MASLTDYFERRDADLPKPKYPYGSRVFGHWNKIPIMGSVIREEKKMVLVHSDLPVLHEGVVRFILKIPRTDVKLVTTQ